MKPSGACKIYFSLLALCYLEVSSVLSQLARGPAFPSPSDTGLLVHTLTDTQVVLWTACLLTTTGVPSEAVAGHRYLQRETVSESPEPTAPLALLSVCLASCPTHNSMIVSMLQGNLKWIAGKDQPIPLFDELDLAADLHQELEHLYQQQQFTTWSFITSSVLQQALSSKLRNIPVSLEAW